MMRLPAEDVEGLVADLLAKYDVGEQAAQSVARNLVWNALVGRDNFTFGRLPIHIERVQRGVLNAQCLVQEDIVSPSVSRLDGRDSFGHYAGEIGMASAIRRASETGAGVCGVYNSNFFGTGAYFVNMAAEAGMVGLALSNSYPKVAAYGGYLPVLGTNPMAFGAPRENGEHVLLDMATSGLAGSTVRQHIDDGTPLPEGLAVAADGAPITDPSKVSQGALLPFGGAKGFGLSLMVEVLAGVLTGAGVSKGVASLYSDFTQSGHSGHFFVAIDIARFMPLPDYFARVEGLLAMIRSSAPDNPPIYPGEVRWHHFARNTRLGVPLTERDMQIVENLGRPVGLSFPWSSAA